VAEHDHTETWTLDDGTPLSLRHIARGDAAKEQAFVRKLSTQSRYFRFHGSIKELDKGDLEKFTNPDPLDTEALIVVHGGGTIEEEVAVARFMVDPSGAGCEFAIVVAPDRTDAWLCSREQLRHAPVRQEAGVRGNQSPR
jgi:acetyltransferase